LPRSSIPTKARLVTGHNRYEICTRFGIEFETVEVEDGHSREAAIAWIVANQLGRRNLTPSQKGPLGMELKKQLAAEAKKRRGMRTDLVATLPLSEFGKAREKAAEMVGASPRYVQDAKQVAQEAPEIFEQVKQGKLNIPQAKKVAALPAEQRPAATLKQNQSTVMYFSQCSSETISMEKPRSRYSTAFSILRPWVE
jgi:hypothetical protein